MRAVSIAIVALVLGAFPVAGAAQTSAEPPRADGELRLEKKQRRVIVKPRPAPGLAVSDTEQVRAEVERQAREEQVLREGPSRPSRRPDLDRDVTGGIQTRALNNAIRR